MKRVLLLLIFTSFFVFGCSNASEEISVPIKETEEVTSEPTEQQEKKPVSLHFEPFTNVPSIQSVTEFHYDEIIKEQAFYGGKIIIFTIPDNQEQVFGLFESENGRRYDLGVVGGLLSEMDDEEILSIKELSLFNKSIVRIKGMFGANAPFQNYYSIENGEIAPFLRVETGHVTEIDLDNDGTEEIVTTHGTPILTFIYKWEDGQFFVANVNETLGAISVQLIEEKQFEAWFLDTETSNLFEYKDGKMTLKSTN